LVLFCGAGISIPAGLQDFKGLVDKVYELGPSSGGDARRPGTPARAFVV